MKKKKILTGVIVISLIIVCLNYAIGIIQANNCPKAFGILIDNQAGEDITEIRLKVRAYDETNANSFESECWMALKEMLPGNYVEFMFDMNSSEYASADRSDITIIVKTNDEESYTVQDAIGVPIQEGKKTLIKLVGNKTSGLKAEFVHMLKD